jgi:hypothetical protein
MPDDHAAAVEAVRKRHEESERRLDAVRLEYGIDRVAPGWLEAHADRATLLRAYEAVALREKDLIDSLEEEEKENATLRAQHAALVEGLQSIAANTCCDRCQEAALVARQLLATLGGAEGV